MTALSTLLIGIILIASSYYFEGKVINETLTQQGEGLASVLSKQIDLADIEKASASGDLNSDIQKKMTDVLGKVTTDNANVAQAYVVSKAHNSKGGNTIISVPKHVQEVFQPGSEFDDWPDSVFDKAVAAKKPMATAVYADSIGSWFTVLAPMLDANGNVAAVYAIDMSADIIHSSQMSMVKSLGLSLLVLFVVIFLVQFFNLKRMLAPVKELSLAVNQVSAGNLNVELHVRNQDEVGVVVSGFNEMVSKIRATLTDLDATSHQMRATFQEVAAVSETTKDQANNVVLSLEEITSSTEHLAHEAESGNNQLLEINTKIEEILTNTAEASGSIRGCVDLSNDSITVIESLKQKSNETEQVTLNIGKRIYSLEGRMRQINDLLTSIQDVAEQTGLLSLNASIEAARAGEHGRGFSIVAEEIRKLSTNSKQASTEIAALLRDISQDVGSTGQEMRVAEESLREQSQQVDDTIQSFYRIRENILMLVDNIQKVDESIQIVQDGKETLLATVESVSSMSEETAASVEMILQNFMDQVKLVENLNNSCQVLQEQATAGASRLEQSETQDDTL
jgi:methyl-accepting chemotaxis protein